MDKSILGNLPGFYWFIRYYTRNASLKRRYYRYVAKEKALLIAAGVDVECLRRYCRALAKVHCRFARRNYEAYRDNCRACR